MSISKQRLERLLSSYGYEPKRSTPHSFSFVTRRARQELFLELGVDFQGRQNEAVYGSVGISVTKWIPRETDDGITLVEIATDKERGWTLIESRGEAVDWENAFVAIAPAAASNLADRVGGSLIQRTTTYREEASQVLLTCDDADCVEVALDSARDKLSRELIEDAYRLAGWPGVVQLEDTEDIYLLSCCLLLGFTKGYQTAGEDPLENDALMWRIQLIADGLIDRFYHGLPHGSESC